MEKELEQIFIRDHLRLTRPRREVFSVLRDTSTPLSIVEIADLCTNADRTSIYRTIDIFTKLGITRVVPRGWKQLYELTDPFRKHHHHLSCTRCGLLIDLHSERFEELVDVIARKYNFVASDHTFEIHGLCKGCRQ